MIQELKKIDRFYLLFGAVLLVLSILAIVTLKVVFSAYGVSGTIDQSLLEASSPRIDLELLDQTYGNIMVRKTVPLDVK